MLHSRAKVPELIGKLYNKRIYFWKLLSTPLEIFKSKI